MLAGRPLLEWTLEAFQNHAGIDSITLVGSAGDLERLQAAAALFPKVGKVIVGGTTRAESVKNGLDTLPDTTELVLVHDAARPLVSAAVIDRIIEASRRVGAAVPGLPLSDTVKRADASGLVRATIPRAITKGAETLAGLTAVQTPQGVRAALLRLAYGRYDYAQGEPTDEASLVEALGEPVQIVTGDPINIKITRQEDLALAEDLGRTRFAAAGAYGLTALTSSAQPAATTPALGTAAVSSSVASLDMPGDGQGSSLPSSPSSFRLLSPPSDLTHPEYRTGFGYDVHAFASPESGRKLFLGGIEIPHDRGLEGHSDADVLLHAVCDALLGAASLGDIGILFPNTDDAYKGISSLKLLTVVAQRLHEAGWRIVNVDATVIAEAPRLMPHRIAMQQTMAASLAIDADRVSVKATTAEKLGFVGRREGMEASAIATIVRS